MPQHLGVTGTHPPKASLGQKALLSKKIANGV